MRRGVGSQLVVLLAAFCAAMHSTDTGKQEIQWRVGIGRISGPRQRRSARRVRGAPSRNAPRRTPGWVRARSPWVWARPWRVGPVLPTPTTPVPTLPPRPVAAARTVRHPVQGRPARARHARRPTPPTPTAAPAQMTARNRHRITQPATPHLRAGCPRAPTACPLRRRPPRGHARRLPDDPDRP